MSRADGGAERRSYEPDRGAGGLAGELLRLEAQAALTAAIEIRHLAGFGFQDGMRILEAGSGPGFFTRALCAAFPRAAIVALEPDRRWLPHAASLGLPGVTQACGTLEASGLEEAGFDAIVSRYLFQHLSAPELAARAALELLRPGGRHAIIDIDDALWGLASPETPGVRAIAARQVGAQRARGGDRLIGRKLRRLLRDAGYREVGAELFLADSDDLGLAPFLPQMRPERLIAAIGARHLSLSDVATLHAGFEAFLRHPEAQVMMTGFIACGRRP